MVNNCQIIIVGTGFNGNGSIQDYYASVNYNYDHPAYVILRDGTLEKSPTGYGMTVAIENDGPLMHWNGLFYPAMVGRDGRLHPVESAKPRVPYEFCSCKPYHGCQHYEYVGDKQLATLRTVLVRWLQVSGIRYPYDNQLGTVCPRAKAGKSGIYFASSFDPTRADIHPQREIIDIIKAFAK